jgi:putative DNA primase/helicase
MTLKPNEEPEQLVVNKLSDPADTITVHEVAVLSNDTGDPNTDSAERLSPHDPIDGRMLLHAIVAIIERYIACERYVAQAAALWIMFSWCIKVMKIAPIACITAPEKRCGKTQLLRLMYFLSRNPLKADNITTAALFRSIEKWKPILFIDEYDAFLKGNEEMRGVLNAGFEYDGCVIRTNPKTFEPTEFNVFCAKVISGIGHLPDTLKDRSIMLELRRKRKDETRERLRYADPTEFEIIKDKLAQWSDGNIEALRDARPVLPESLNDRAQDCWEPLLAIADQVGGEWSEIARDVAIAISGSEEASPSINEELLADIKLIFQSVNTLNISSFDLLFKLCEDDELPWATWNKGKPMTPRQLSTRLSDFNVSSKQIRQGAKTMKGYVVADFQDAFDRY